MSDFALSMFIMAGFWLGLLALIGIISLIISDLDDKGDNEE